MGLFDRFTGKEIEESIEVYSTKYGDILIGIHKKLQSHDKQFVNMIEKLDSLKGNLEANKRTMQLFLMNNERCIVLFVAVIFDFILVNRCLSHSAIQMLLPQES